MLRLRAVNDADALVMQAARIWGDAMLDRDERDMHEEILLTRHRAAVATSYAPPRRPRDAHRDAAVGMAVGRVRHRTTQRELATPSRGIVYKERGGAGGWREEERRDDEERC